MKITFLGHSAFLVEGSKTILFDPFLTGNPRASIRAEGVNPDYILVSHAHNDHLADAPDISRRTGAPIICVNELAQYLQDQDISCHAMHIGGFHRFDDGFSVKVTAALHGAANDGFDRANMGLACGFIINLDGQVLYYAGDTGLTYDMKAVIGDLHEIDVAVLPIGDNFTMGPDDAAVAAKWLGSKYVIPMHYNTFPIIEQDGEAFAEKVKAQCNAKTVILKPGETFDL